MTANDTYDLVILGGRVMDLESGVDDVCNVGIVGGTITTITSDLISGKEVIDATGHVVVPGFIDCHVHTVDLPIAQKLMLRDGVTTQLDLETGAQPVERFHDFVGPWAQANYGCSVDALGSREQTFNPKYHSETGTITTDIIAKDVSPCRPAPTTCPLRSSASSPASEAACSATSSPIRFPAYSRAATSTQPQPSPGRSSTSPSLELSVSPTIALWLPAFAIFSIRMLSLHYGWGLPKFDARQQ